MENVRDFHFGMPLTECCEVFDVFKCWKPKEFQRATKTIIGYGYFKTFLIFRNI